MHFEGYPNRLLMRLKIIESITLADFSIVMTDQSEAYAPLASSYYTTAVYKNPFGFSLQVVQSAVDMTVGLANNGTDVATVRTLIYLVMQVPDHHVVDTSAIEQRRRCFYRERR